MTEEKLREIHGSGSELKKLILQEASSTKYQSEGKGIVNDLTGNQYTIAHLEKVKNFQTRVEKYQKTLDGIDEYDTSPLKERVSGSKAAHSKGLADLFER